MIAQQHKIMRQVLEVRGCSRDAAQHVQSELRDAYRERLLPLIEAICSELSAPGRIDRVDRLEIDCCTNNRAPAMQLCPVEEKTP